jgi:hypothetical protein
VDGTTPVLAANGANPIAVGTPDWFTWLEGATSFAFRGPEGSFTARKETRVRGGWYWKAYRTANGITRRFYFGKAADLTLDQLNHAAATLVAARASAQPAVAAPATPAHLPATKPRPPAPHWCHAHA